MRKISLLLLTIFPLFLFIALPSSTFAVTEGTGSVLNTTSSTTGTANSASIPNGQYGCSFNIPTDPKVITIPPANMIVSCQSGGVCVPDQNKSTITLINGTPALVNGLCVSTNNQCPICDSGYEYSNQAKNCIASNDSTKSKSVIRYDSCLTNQGCNPGYGCVTGLVSSLSQPLSLCTGGTCKTALGDLPTNLSALLTRVFSIVLSIAGIVALGLIIISGYRIMVSQGNPEQIKNAREQLTAAIIGLLFIIFSLVILQIIGANILRIPGFS